MTSSFDSLEYPRPIERLIDPGHDDRSTSAIDLEKKLESFDFAAAVAPRPVVDEEMAQCCASGLWLKHHFLHRSHEISQQIHSSTGSYWHGIMHRLEGDFGNAKYWFRKVGDHPIFPSLASAAHTVDPKSFADASHWDPYSFVDHCKEAAGESVSDSTLLEVASLEWNLLFAYCFRQALQIE